MNKKTILFLDVDGVFSIPNLQNTDERRDGDDQSRAGPD